MKPVLISVLLSSFVSHFVLASDFEFISLCDDSDKTQSSKFIVEETSLKLKITQIYASGGQSLVRVFSASVKELEKTDYLLKGDLDLVLSSLPEDQELIEEAGVVLETEGETGPVIQNFTLYPKNDLDPLVVISESKPVPCTQASDR